MGKKISKSDFSIAKIEKKALKSQKKDFQGLNINISQKKTTETCKIFRLSLTTDELEQFLYFKGFVEKEAKDCFF